jgi:hypothetical protein
VNFRFVSCYFLFFSFYWCFAFDTTILAGVLFSLPTLCSVFLFCTVAGCLFLLPLRLVYVCVYFTVPLLSLSRPWSSITTELDIAKAVLTHICINNKKEDNARGTKQNYSLRNDKKKTVIKSTHIYIRIYISLVSYVYKRLQAPLCAPPPLRFPFFSSRFCFRKSLPLRSSFIKCPTSLCCFFCFFCL